MSCFMTIDGVRTRRKTVTRRHVDTWKTVDIGDRLTLIEKGMGLPKGAKQVVLAEVEIVSVTVERLRCLEDLPVSEALAEVEKEGLDISPPFTPRLFCEWWALEHGYSRVEFDSDSIHCRRIEWRYLDEVDR